MFSPDSALWALIDYSLDLFRRSKDRGQDNFVCRCPQLCKKTAGRTAGFAGMKAGTRRETLSRKWPAMYRHCPRGSQ
jgi:hypothetical protein